MEDDMVVSKRTVNTNIRNNLLDYTKEVVALFLEDHRSLRFYAFALDVNTETGEVDLSMNTDFDFYRKLRYFEVNDPKANCDCDLWKMNMRFDTLNWNYQGIGSIEPVEPDLYNHYYANDPDGYLEVIEGVVREFKKTPVFKKIPKTDPFNLLVRIDHESLEAYCNRTETALQTFAIQEGNAS